MRYSRFIPVLAVLALALPFTPASADPLGDRATELAALQMPTVAPVFHAPAAALSSPLPMVLAQVDAPAAPAPSADLKGALLTGFIQYLLPVIFTGLAALLGWVFVQLGRKYGTEAGTGKKNQVLGHLFALAQSVVADLEATLKPKLVAASADGVLTKEEIDHLRMVALMRLKALAGEKGLEEAKFVLGIAAPELEAFLMGIIERAVDNQPSKGSAPSPAASLNQALSAAASHPA